MRRILFVDDEQDVLDSMRDALRAYSPGGTMVFATGGREALALLATERFDVVVSDMRMPGMDGAALLTEVRARYPATARVVLSGYADPHLAARAAGVAHLFLSKPCGARALMAGIDRACDLLGEA